MLEMRNVLNKKLNKKGFTLAELLVVVAIIAILVALSIPIFTGKLNEARVNTDKANVRAAKAAAVTEYLQNEKNTDQFYNAEDGVMVSTAALAKNDDGKGYNQSERTTEKFAAGAAVVKVVITEADGKATAKATWVEAK